MVIEEYRQCFESYEISNLGNVRRKLANGDYIPIKGSLLRVGGGYLYFQTLKMNVRHTFQNKKYQLFDLLHMTSKQNVTNQE